MKKWSSIPFGFALALAGPGEALAQDQPPVVLPVELFLCNYIGGNDIDDLNAVNDDYNEWADANGLNSITSLVLTPNFHSDELEFDVIGMDIWESGAAMGSGIAQMMAPGSPIPDYEEVVDCPAHQMFALVGIKPPQDEGETAVFEFTDCTVKENRTADDGIVAVTAVVELWADWGVGDAHAVLFPVAGEAGDADYTFKWLTRYPSWEAFGTVFDRYAAGAVAQAGQILENVMECNSSRMYDVTSIRQMQTE